MLHSGTHEYYQDAQIILEKNEYITQMEWTSDNIGIIGLKFVTNNGRSVELQGDTDSKYATKLNKSFTEQGQVICAFKTDFKHYMTNISCYTQTKKEGKSPYYKEGRPKPLRFTKNNSAPGRRPVELDLDRPLTTIREIDSS